MKKLRPHQERGITELRLSLARGAKRPMLQIPTGGGKTLASANIIRMALKKGNRVTFCVPAISLIDQTVEEFFKEGITDIGVIQGNHPMVNYAAPVQVASVQTLSARKIRPECDLVIVDEAHQQFKVVREWMKANPKLPFIGLSATPWAKGLGKQYDDLIAPTNIKQLIEAGYLSPFRVFAPAHPDLSSVKTRAGDYNKEQLGEVMSDSVLIADVVETWKKLGRGRPTLCFAVNRAHAKALQTKFELSGVGCGYIDAYTEAVDRKAIEAKLNRGEIEVVCNVGCLTTGVDWDVRCIILARPTRSEMLFTQMIGRGLRTAEGKQDCLILDHADNHARLGFVSDIHYTELCDGKRGERKAPEKKEPLPKECGKCHYVKPPKVHECPSCGFKPERQSEVEVEDGELVEIKKKKKYTKEEKQEFYSGLIAIALHRGRSRGWVSHTYRDRFKCWPRGLESYQVKPSAEVISYVRSKDIRYAKRRVQI